MDSCHITSIPSLLVHRANGELGEILMSWRTFTVFLKLHVPHCQNWFGLTFDPALLLWWNWEIWQTKRKLTLLLDFWVSNLISHLGYYLISTSQVRACCTSQYLSVLVKICLSSQSMVVGRAQWIDSGGSLWQIRKHRVYAERSERHLQGPPLMTLVVIFCLCCN